MKISELIFNLQIRLQQDGDQEVTLSDERHAHIRDKNAIIGAVVSTDTECVIMGVSQEMLDQAEED